MSVATSCGGSSSTASLSTSRSHSLDRQMYTDCKLMVVTGAVNGDGDSMSTAPARNRHYGSIHQSATTKDKHFAYEHLAAYLPETPRGSQSRCQSPEAYYFDPIAEDRRRPRPMTVPPCPVFKAFPASLLVAPNPGKPPYPRDLDMVHTGARLRTTCLDEPIDDDMECVDQGIFTNSCPVQDQPRRWKRGKRGGAKHRTKGGEAKNQRQQMQNASVDNNVLGQAS